MKIFVLLSLAAVVLSAPQRGGPRPRPRPSSRQSLPSSPTAGPSPPSLPAAPGTCDAVGLANITQPVATTPLPAPDGMVLASILVGRGVQNYTCAANSTTAPVQLGAVATLYEASCAAAADSGILSTVSQEAFDIPMGPGGSAPPSLRCSAGPLQRAGQHFFTAAGVPAFDLTGDKSLGLAMVSKLNAATAPAGSNAVAWLQLVKAAGTTGPIEAIYRLQTVGGSPPATCDGQPGLISVQYAAQYWVYTASA